MAEPKRPGRPRMVDDDTTTPITIRVPTRDFDRACERASRERVRVPDLIRRALTRELDDDDE